jgi:hypothetical protein
MRTETPNPAPTRRVTAPRLRRSAAAVIAQYIQDLTHPSDPAPSASAA